MPVLQMIAPEFGYGFRWEPESRRLYIVHTDGQTHEQIAADVMSPELAQQLAQMWIRGYRSRVREAKREPGKKYYHMLAESGAIGVEGNKLR